MKFYSTLAVLAQLAMLGSLVQATFPTEDLVQYSTRELVEELQTRMVMAKRTVPDPSYGSHTSHYGPVRRSGLDDSFLDFASREPPVSADGMPVDSGPGVGSPPVSSNTNAGHAEHGTTGFLGGMRKKATTAAKGIGNYVVGKALPIFLPNFGGGPLKLS